jgi:hypothetical protein
MNYASILQVGKANAIDLKIYDYSEIPAQEDAWDKRALSISSAMYMNLKY